MQNEKIQHHLAVASEILNAIFIFAFVYSLLWVGFAFGF